jgi:hypothetical protein
MLQSNFIVRQSQKLHRLQHFYPRVRLVSDTITTIYQERNTYDHKTTMENPSSDGD